MRAAVSDLLPLIGSHQLLQSVQFVQYTDASKTEMCIRHGKIFEINKQILLETIKKVLSSN